MRNKAVLLFIILLDVMSIGILIPILPAIFQGMHLPQIVTNPQINTVIWYSGIIGLHPICAFFSSPFLGTLSDRVGRKWVLVVSLVGSVIAFILNIVGVMGGSLIILALARIIDGGTAGNIAVARAALLDQTDKNSVTGTVGLVGALFGIGMMAGPLLGGSTWTLFHLSQINSTLTIAAILSLLACLVTILFFRETHNPETNTATEPLKLLPRPEPELRLQALASVLYTLGFGVFTTYWALYVYSAFHYGQHQIGQMFFFLGICIAFVQGIVVRAVARVVPTKQVLLNVLPLLALAVVILSNVSSTYIYLALGFFALANGLVMANRLAMMTSYGVRYGQGYISGLETAYTSLAAALSPALLALASLGGTQVPFWVITGVFLALYIVVIIIHDYHSEFISELQAEE